MGKYRFNIIYFTKSLIIYYCYFVTIRIFVDIRLRHLA